MGNYHDWSETNFDWNSLDKGIRTIDWILKKIGRIGAHSKEKYGTARISTYFFSGHLHDLTHPGYVSSRYPKWLWRFDVKYVPYFFQYTGIGWLIGQYQKAIYCIAYHIAMKRFPHIKEELCVDADFPEFIIGGMKVHDKYWTKVK